MFIEAGILICIYKNNILLYSGESYETINETMKWLEKNKSLIKGISTNSQIVYGYDNTFMDVLKYNGSSYTEHFSLEKDGYTYINLSKEIDYRSKRRRDQTYWLTWRKYSNILKIHLLEYPRIYLKSAY